MVHNATSRRSGDPVRLEDVDDALFEEHVSVSLRAAYSCAIAALPQLQANRGSLITMTSPAGMEGSLTLPAYGAVKAALRAVHEEPRPRVGAARDHREHGRAARDDARDGACLAGGPVARGADVTNRVPLGWLGDPEADIGPAVVFLAARARDT